MCSDPALQDPAIMEPAWIILLSPLWRAGKCDQWWCVAAAGVRLLINQSGFPAVTRDDESFAHSYGTVHSRKRDELRT